jgi:hypothetical protein
VNNAPIRFTDPSGHSASLCSPGEACGGQYQYGPGGLDDNAKNLGIANYVPTEKKPSKTKRIDNQSNGYGCTEELKVCYEKGILADIPKHIDQQEFDDLLVSVATDMDNGMTLPTNVGGFLSGRWTFDTPFYNGGGRGGYDDPPYESYESTLIGNSDSYSNRSEINYFAQGMWSAAAGESLDRALKYTTDWNGTWYKLTPEQIPGKLYWTEYGYSWYQNWQEWGDQWSQHWVAPDKDKYYE